MYVIVLMMKYPDIQNKVQEEIRKATGDNELVTLADKDNIPYTEATLNEVWRFCNIVPFTGPRKVAGQLKVGNFEIPSGVYYQALIYPFCVHVSNRSQIGAQTDTKATFHPL